MLSTGWPISVLSSGTATSVKNFIFRRSFSKTPIDWRTGNRRLPNSARNAPPTSSTAMPKGAISNRLKCASPCPAATPSTRMLVEVPINVIIPPITVR